MVLIMAPQVETPSNNLWVGNLAPEVTNADLESLFQRYGTLNSVTIHSSHGFGIIHFRYVNDSKEAKDALQGSFFHGIPLKINFAKPEQGPEFWEMWDGQYPKRSIGRPNPRLMSQDFVWNYSDPIYAGFTRQHEQGPEFGEIRDGKYPNRSIGSRPDPMYDAGVTRQHPFQLPVGESVDGQPSRVLCISYPPSVHVDEAMLHNAMILFGEIYNIKTFYDRNFSLVLFRSVEEAQCAKEALQGKLFNDPSISIEYSSSGPAPGRDFLEYHPSIIGQTANSYPNENPFQPAQMGMFGHNRPMLAPNVPGHLPPYGIHGPDIPADSRISPGQQHHSGHDYSWRGIIAKGGIPLCIARCYPFGEIIESKIPDIVNCSSRTGLDKLAEHYADAVGFSIVHFLPDTKKDCYSYTDILTYLSSNDRAWVAKLGDGTNLFLVPPSDFLKNVLKVDGPTCIYGVVLKYARYTPSDTSSQAAYDALLSAGRDLLTPELNAAITNMLSSGSVEGTAGASAGMPASDVSAAQQSWRYEQQAYPQLQLGTHQDARIAHGTASSA